MLRARFWETFDLRGSYVPFLIYVNNKSERPACDKDPKREECCLKVSVLTQDTFITCFIFLLVSALNCCFTCCIKWFYQRNYNWESWSLWQRIFFHWINQFKALTISNISADGTHNFLKNGEIHPFPWTSRTCKTKIYCVYLFYIYNLKS